MDRLEKTRLLEDYSKGESLLRETLSTLPSALMDFKPTPTRWSVREILVHLSDSEIQSHVRCRMIIAEPGSTIPNHDEYKWSVVLDYSHQDINMALATISLMRQCNHALLVSLPDPVWSNACVHSVRGAITLEDWLRTY